MKRFLVLLIAFVAWFSGSAIAAEDAVKQNLLRSQTAKEPSEPALYPEFRIGIIGEDPGKLLHDFSPLVQYLKSGLRRSGIRNVSVFVAKDLNQLRVRIQKGKLDFILTTAFPIIHLERHEMIPAVVALNGFTRREESAVFFVRKQSSLQKLTDLRGKSIVFGSPSSTAAYAMAVAELKKNKLFLNEPTDRDAPEDAIRYSFAGEAINEAIRVIRDEADAGVFSSSDWKALPRQEQSRLRIIHRTGPVIRLLGAFRPAFPASVREVVEKELIDMPGTGKGRAALAALKITAFDRMTEQDANSLQRLKDELSEADQ